MVQPIEVSVTPVSEVRYRMVLDADQLKAVLVDALVSRARLFGRPDGFRVEHCMLRTEGAGTGALATGADVEISIDSGLRPHESDVNVVNVINGAAHAHPDSAAILAHSTETRERKPDSRTL